MFEPQAYRRLREIRSRVDPDGLLLANHPIPAAPEGTLGRSAVMTRGRSAVATTTGTSIEQILGDEAEDLLTHRCGTIPAERLTLPSPRWVDEQIGHLRPARPRCCARCSRCSTTGSLAGTGYMSILPVDQGIEHSAGASFAPNPDYFDPLRIVELAVEGGCNAVATTLGGLGLAARALVPPHPVPAQAQPQRVPVVPQRLRPDHVRLGAPGARAGRGGGRRDDLLRLGGVEAPDPGGLGGLRGGPRARDGHGAVVLPAQLGLQHDRRRAAPTTTSPPTSRARRTTSA